jgi:hypothetical protein
MLVVFGEVGFEESFQVFAGLVNGLLKALTSQNTEETFDQVDPRGMGWRVVEADVRVKLEPISRLLILVCVQIVQDDIEPLAL